MADMSMPSPDSTPPALQLFGVPYLDFLALLNTHLAPQSYLEIGTNHGESLSRFTCDAVAVDTEFLLQENMLGQRDRSFLFRMSSDVFFRSHNVRGYFPHGVDLAFLDGMHRVEYLLRDFINTEAVMHRRSLVLLHDCLPLNARMARRSYVPGGPEEGGSAQAWTGDVWKLLPILKHYRPDLRVVLLDCPPTGLVAISHVDPESTVLDQNYHEIMDEFGPMSLESYGLARLWSEFPLMDSRTLYDNPDDLSAVLSVY